MTAKQRRWVCGECNDGVLAPSKPRRDDVRRYCLDCSKRTGKLIERTCPALDRERAASTAKRTERAKAKRETATRQRTAAKATEKAKLNRHFSAKHPVTGEVVDARKELPKVWRAARKVEPRLRERPPELVASRGSGSYAYTAYGEIHLAECAGWLTLVHEVAHFVRAAQGNRRRDDGKRAVHDRAFYYVLKDIVEQLVPDLRISFYGVTKWGYSVDGVIAQQVWALSAAKAGA